MTNYTNVLMNFEFFYTTVVYTSKNDFLSFILYTTHGTRTIPKDRAK